MSNSTITLMVAGGLLLTCLTIYMFYAIEMRKNSGLRIFLKHYFAEIKRISKAYKKIPIEIMCGIDETIDGLKDVGKGLIVFFGCLLILLCYPINIIVAPFITYLKKKADVKVKKDVEG